MAQTPQEVKTEDYREKETADLHLNKYNVKKTTVTKVIIGNSLRNCSDLALIYQRCCHVIIDKSYSVTTTRFSLNIKQNKKTRKSLCGTDS